MKSLSLKVMTLLMAALVLSASGCFNDEMSSPEGTVKGYYRALYQNNFNKMLNYCDPREVSKDDRISVSQLEATSKLARAIGEESGAIGKSEFKMTLTDVKTTLVSEKESLVWKDNEWYRVKNENATVEFSAKWNDENIQDTVKLVLLDNKWYVADF
ncbi:MAG: hypothetical protein V3R78_14285 [Thermodesulfobacteriota bacterium]